VAFVVVAFSVSTYGVVGVNVKAHDVGSTDFNRICLRQLDRAYRNFVVGGSEAEICVGVIAADIEHVAVEPFQKGNPKARRIRVSRGLNFSRGVTVPASTDKCGG
jgi:hypothetical protein